MELLPGKIDRAAGRLSRCQAPGSVIGGLRGKDCRFEGDDLL